MHAIKTGILFGSEITESVASSLKTYFRTHGRVPFVCDSVYVSDYGAVLSGEDVRMIVEGLFPLAQVITLSETEAQYLLNIEGHPLKIASLYDMLVAAQNLLALGSQAVLLKGGQTIVSLSDLLTVKAPNDASLKIKSDFPLGDDIEILGISNMLETKDHVVDVLCRASNTSESSALTFTLYPRLALKSKNIQGADAALSAALACALGNEIPRNCFQRISLPIFLAYALQIIVEEAVAQATTFTRLGIESASPLGKGSGSSSLNHLHSTSRLIVQP